jgi:hypothetical protein
MQQERGEEDYFQDMVEKPGEKVTSKEDQDVDGWIIL